MRIRFLIIAALTVAANSVEAQQPRGLRGWSFGPIGPHVTDASKRTALSVAWGAARFAEPMPPRFSWRYSSVTPITKADVMTPITSPIC